MEGWRYALASVVGTSHLASGTPCQDASTCQVLEDGSGRSVLVAFVADGAGSALYADEGATLAFSKAQARKVLDAPPEDTIAGLRDRAILSIGLQVGLRRHLGWM